MSDLIDRDEAIEAIRKLPNAGTRWIVSAESVFKVLMQLPSARPKEERIAIGAVCEVICKHCIKANGCCQHHWKCPLLTEIAELIESKDEPQTEREGK